MNEEEKGKEKILNKDLQLREIHTVWGPVEAEVTKSFLQSYGIKCILKGLVVQSVHAFSADGLGEIKIFVSEKDYKQAKKLINEKLSKKLK